MLNIMGYNNIKRNHKYHHSVNHGRSYIDFDQNVFQSRIIPRLTIIVDSEYIGEYGYELKEFYQSVLLLFDDENIDNTECNNCEYSENCNGQMCFFSMM